MNTISLEIAGRLALAGLTGLAVGVEREWSGHASGPRARFGGVRTFLLLGLIGDSRSGIAGIPKAAAPGLLALAAVVGGTPGMALKVSAEAGRGRCR